MFETLVNQPKLVMTLAILLSIIFVWGSMFLILRCILTFRRLTNQERMKMIDAGQSVDLLKSHDRRARRNRFFSVALALALWVPTIALIGATVATVATDGSLGTAIVVWVAAFGACIASVVCATLVIVRQRETHDS